eukprot:5036225-Amphidinium_carterae.2
MKFGLVVLSSCQADCSGPRTVRAPRLHSEATSSALSVNVWNDDADNLDRQPLAPYGPYLKNLVWTMTRCGLEHGLDNYLKVKGLRCILVDAVKGAMQFDLSAMAGVILSPPCSTFSATGIILVVLDHLGALKEEKAAVKLGTLLVLRADMAMQICINKGILFIFENPFPPKGCTSIVLLPENEAIVKHSTSG